MAGRRLAVAGMVVVGLLLLVTLGVVWSRNGTSPPDEVQLGKAIFFDEDLSLEMNQSCASCHGPEVGFTGPDEATNLHGTAYEGSVTGSFGSRKPPSAAYATTSPIFHQNTTGMFIGGNFWDGRATGEQIGNPAADQAQGPFLNPVEQALPESACVVYRVCNADYGAEFTAVWGEESCDIAWPEDLEDTCRQPGRTVTLSSQDRAKSDAAYDQIALSIAAYEASPEVNAFSSKFDSNAGLTAQERTGRMLFMRKGRCSVCHTPMGPTPLFTDYSFDNLGVPPNPENPVYDVDPDFVDAGLGGFLEAAGYDEAVYLQEWGKQKVPTLRNVDKRPYPEFVKAYMHNGYFKTLYGIVHFYNTRDVLPVCPGVGTDTYTEAEALAADCWPAPEVAENVNTGELGNLGLTFDEEMAIVAFLKTLSDGYTP